jgi:hypothetical protein
MLRTDPDFVENFPQGVGDNVGEVIRYLAQVQEGIGREDLVASLSSPEWERSGPTEGPFKAGVAHRTISFLGTTFGVRLAIENDRLDNVDIRLDLPARELDDAWKAWSRLVTFLGAVFGDEDEFDITTWRFAISTIWACEDASLVAYVHQGEGNFRVGVRMYRFDPEAAAPLPIP